MDMCVASHIVRIDLKFDGMAETGKFNIWHARPYLSTHTTSVPCVGLREKLIFQFGSGGNLAVEQNKKQRYKMLPLLDCVTCRRSDSLSN